MSYPVNCRKWLTVERFARPAGASPGGVAAVAGAVPLLSAGSLRGKANASRGTYQNWAYSGGFGKSRVNGPFGGDQQIGMPLTIL